MHVASTPFAFADGALGGALLIGSLTVTAPWLARRSPFLNPYVTMLVSQLGAASAGFALWFALTLPLVPLVRHPVGIRIAFAYGTVTGVFAASIPALIRARSMLVVTGAFCLLLFAMWLRSP